MVLIEEIELGVQLMAQKEFDDDSPAAQLLTEAAQAFLIGIGGGAQQELVAKLLGNTLFEAQHGGLIDILPTA